jgi:hypothetical protein
MRRSENTPTSKAEQIFCHETGIVVVEGIADKVGIVRE